MREWTQNNCRPQGGTHFPSMIKLNNVCRRSEAAVADRCKKWKIKRAEQQSRWAWDNWDQQRNKHLWPKFGYAAKGGSPPPQVPMDEYPTFCLTCKQRADGKGGCGCQPVWSSQQRDHTSHPDIGIDKQWQQYYWYMGMQQYRTIDKFGESRIDYGWPEEPNPWANLS